MAEVKLYSADASVYGQRVEIALREKGIPFELVVVDLLNKSKDFLDTNPIHKKVPVLVHNGKILAESTVILEYLEEAWPKHVPLLPEDPYQRSQVRFWADFIANHVCKTIVASFFNPAPDHPAVALSDGYFQTIEDAMCGYSSEGPFFTGATFGLLDVILAPLPSWEVILEQVSGIQIPGPERLPRFHKWVAAIRARPSAMAALPTPERALANFNHLLKGILARRAAAAAAATV